MDSDRFDRLARQFASATSRRSLVKGALAAAVAAVASVTGAEAAQVLRRPGEICRKDGDCIAGTTCEPTATGRSVCTCVTGTKPCRGACIPTASCCTVADCADDGNACTTTACNPNGTCVHLNRPNGTACSDGNLCTTADSCQNGACTGTPIICDTCQSCVGGTCSTVTDGTSCGAGLTCCGGECVDLNTSTSHCTRCGNACPAELPGAIVSCGTVVDDQDPNVVESGCLYQCFGVWADCDGNPSNGCETDLSKEPNCGNCGVTCAEDQCCSGCKCVPQSFCDQNIGQTCEGILRTARLIR